MLWDMICVFSHRGLSSSLLSQEFSRLDRDEGGGSVHVSEVTTSSLTPAIKLVERKYSYSFPRS